MKINIVSRDNGVGLSRDIQIIKKLLLAKGHTVSFNDFSKVNSNELFDLNIFLEVINIRWLTRSKENWLIPNQEWFEPRWKPSLFRFNKILCKTKDAQRIFTLINKRSKYIGFTSDDRYLPNIEKDFNQYLHVAGKSGTKQTDIIWKTWEENPQLPHLTIVQNKLKFIERKILPNLTYIWDYLPEQELKELQNKCGVHLCPSEAEGFGHYIMEGLSCESVVLTTNAPPMNELIKEEHGFFCPYETSSKQNLSTCYKTNSKLLLNSINNIINCSKETIINKAKKAREFFLEQNCIFENNLLELFKK